MKEIWKKVVGFNKYEVSNLGRVRSLYKYDVNKRKNKWRFTWRIKILKITYYTVTSKLLYKSASLLSNEFGTQKKFSIKNKSKVLFQYVHLFILFLLQVYEFVDLWVWYTLFKEEKRMKEITGIWWVVVIAFIILTLIIFLWCCTKISSMYEDNNKK